MLKEEYRKSDVIYTNAAEYVAPDTACGNEDLWGPSVQYPTTAEDTCSFLSHATYSWMNDIIDKASKEPLTTEDIPPPTKDVRAHECGSRLSIAVEKAMHLRRSWDVMIGEEVVSRKDPNSRGVLRWVGVPQQGDYGSVMAAVEWVEPPAHRTAEASDAEFSPFFNGVVHGEKLFVPERQDACTLEEVQSIAFYGSNGVPPLPKRVFLPKVLLKTLPRNLCLQVPFVFIANIAQLAQPMILQRFIAYLEAKEESSRTWKSGIALVCIFFAVQAIQIFFSHRSAFYAIKGGLQYRSALNSIIFEKCFKIAGKSLARPDMNVGRIINMVSSDSERAYFVMMIGSQIFSAPFVFIGSMIILSQLVGWCAIMAIVAFLCTVPINAYYMNKQVKARRGIMKATDARVRATNEFFSGIRVTKFMTWEPRFIAVIEQKRAIELEYLKSIQASRVMMSFINTATPTIMIAVVFLLYYATGHDLTPTVVFPTISILGMIRMPFLQIPMAFTFLTQFFISMSRITKFLECEDNSRQSIHDIADLYQSGGRETFCQAAAYLDSVDVTVYVPFKLPFAPKIKTSLFSRGLRMLCCCGPCSAQALRPTPSAERTEEEGNNASPPGSSSASQGAKPSGPSPGGAGAGRPGKPMAEEPSYVVEPKVLLRDIKVAVPAGKLTVVVGATGSGKSTLLLALLGQLEVSRGHVWATRSIAYVPQQSWIMNATLRDNVLFFSDLDEARLNEALRVSQMETDLELLNNGLDTEIGEKGVNLSGGQKARVNLARAVYADREMYLLDDPLSALDAHVGESVVEDCILGKLRNKTRVLATHQLHVVPKADYIIALDGCKIAFTGDSDAFQKTALYRLMVASEKEENERSLKSLEGEDSLDLPNDELDEVKVEKTVAQKPVEEEANKLIILEEKARGSVPLSTYLKYFDFCGGRKVACFVLLVYLLTELVTLGSSIWLSLWSTMRLDLSVRVYLPVYIAFVLVGTACTPLRFSVAYSAMRTACKTVHKALLRSVARGTMEFFDRTPQGRIMNRFSSDVDSIDNTLQMSLIAVLDSMFSITSAFLISIISQPLIILPLVPCVYFYYRLSGYYIAANREIRRQTSITKSPLFSLLSEVTVGMAIITAFDCRPTVMTEALRRIDAVFACGYMQNVIGHWIGVRIEFLSCILVTSIAFFGVVVLLTSSGFADVALISLSLTLTLQTTFQLNWLVRQVATVEADMNSVERIQYYSTQIQKEDMPELDQEADEASRQAGLAGGAANTQTDSVSIVPPSESKAPTAVQAGSLEFRGVQMRYREGLPLVLSDVSFRIEPREKVGIVGRTGSGKSTLLLTFMRMVDVCGGTIEVNGRAIRSYPLRELRRQFSMIPQDPVLFDGTVRLNVDPFLQASAAEVWSALEIVGLKERVSSEPEGIDGRVLEGGSNFSVGQRQLLCMARALLKKGSGFILMDEATANIDQSLDRQIQGTVMRAFADYTVITIAHRLLTVAQYDKIIVMDHGVVAEMGSPRELVTREDSVFRGMVDSTGKRAKAQFMALVDA